MNVHEQLGVTQEAFTEMVVEETSSRMVDHLVEEDRLGVEVKALVEERVKQAVEAAADKMAGGSLDALVEGRIEETILQKTNSWGEAEGDALTFRQYLVQRAEAYLVEQVNFKGETKGGRKDNYDRFKPEGTRIAHMINSHLHYRIEAAMKEALTVANGAIVEGIEATVKLKLAEISEGMSVALKTPR